MWFKISTMTVIWMIIDISDATIDDGNALEHSFRQRSREDWEDAWHREKFTRCRETLLQHLYWACEKDIYKLTRRSPHLMNSKRIFTKRIETASYPWIPRNQGHQMLRTRRGRSSSITSECCNMAGCTWEEYAEYCPTNKRHIPFI